MRYDADADAGEEAYDMAGLMGELAEVLIHLDGTVRLVLTKGLAETADALRALTLLAAPWHHGIDRTAAAAPAASVAAAAEASPASSPSSHSMGAFMAANPKAHGVAQERLTRRLGGTTGAAKLVRRFVSVARLQEAGDAAQRAAAAAAAGVQPARLLEGAGLSTAESDQAWRSFTGSGSGSGSGSGRGSSSGAGGGVRSVVVTPSSAAWGEELRSLLEERSVEAQVAGGRSSGVATKPRDHRKDVENVDIVCRLSGGRCGVVLQSALYRVYAVDGSRLADAVRDAFDESVDDIQNAQRAEAILLESLQPSPSPAASISSSSSSASASSSSRAASMAPKEVLFIERVTTQVSGLVRRASNEPVGGPAHHGASPEHCPSGGGPPRPQPPLLRHLHAPSHALQQSVCASARSFRPMPSSRSGLTVQRRLHLRRLLLCQRTRMWRMWSSSTVTTTTTTTTNTILKCFRGKPRWKFPNGAYG